MLWRRVKKPLARARSLALLVAAQQISQPSLIIITELERARDREVVTHSQRQRAQIFAIRLGRHMHMSLLEHTENARASTRLSTFSTSTRSGKKFERVIEYWV